MSRWLKLLCRQNETKIVKSTYRLISPALCIANSIHNTRPALCIASFLCFPWYGGAEAVWLITQSDSTGPHRTSPDRIGRVKVSIATYAWFGFLTFMLKHCNIYSLSSLTFNSWLYQCRFCKLGTARFGSKDINNNNDSL